MCWLTARFTSYIGSTSCHLGMTSKQLILHKFYLYTKVSCVACQLIWLYSRKIIKKTHTVKMNDCLVTNIWVGLILKLLCKQTQACTNHSEGGEHSGSPWQMSWIVWEYESPCIPGKRIWFLFTTPVRRSPSLFFFGLISAPTTSCVSTPSSLKRLTRHRHAVDQLWLKKCVCGR